MLKERARILHAAIFSLDLLLIAAAFLVAYWLRDGALPALLPRAFSTPLYPLADYLPLLPLALIIWGLLMLSSGQYRSHRTVPILEEATAILRVTVTGAVVFTLIIFALRLDAKLLADDQISRSWIFLFPLLVFLFLVAEKLAVRVTARYVRVYGLNYRTVLIVGTNRTAREIADSFHHHRYWGFKILGFVASNGDEPPCQRAAGRSAGPRHHRRPAADRRRPPGGRRHLRRRPPRPRPDGGAVPESARAGHPHPLRDEPVPSHPGADSARRARRHAAPHLLHHPHQPAPAAR